MSSKLELRITPALSVSDHARCQPYRLWTSERNLPIIQWEREHDQYEGALRESVGTRFDRLNDAIAESKWILDLKDNFDGEGSVGYSKETWEMAIKFLKNTARWIWNKRGVVMEVPRISPGPSGSIDLHWKTATKELLVNIPSDRKEMASFYGDDYGKLHVKGTLDPSTYNAGLLDWLSKDK